MNERLSYHLDLELEHVLNSWQAKVFIMVYDYQSRSGLCFLSPEMFGFEFGLIPKPVGTRPMDAHTGTVLNKQMALPDHLPTNSVHQLKGISFNNSFRRNRNAKISERLASCKFRIISRFKLRLKIKYCDHYLLLTKLFLMRHRSLLNAREMNVALSFLVYYL